MALFVLRRSLYLVASLCCFTFVLTREKCCRSSLIGTPNGSVFSLRVAWRLAASVVEGAVAGIRSFALCLLGIAISFEINAKLPFQHYAMWEKAIFSAYRVLEDGQSVHLISAQLHSLSVHPVGASY